MAELILDSLKIENYRLLESLTIPRLGRVNLITGKNNVGKTSLLEALRIYADRAAPRTLADILGGREEMAETDVAAVYQALGSLFPGRPAASEPRAVLSVGPVDRSADLLRVNTGWYEDGTESHVTPGMEPVDLSVRNIRPSLEVSLGRSSARLWFEEFARYVSGALIVPDLEQLGRIRCMLVPPEGLRGSLAAGLWDQIALTEFEDAVVEALRTLDPSIDRLSLVAEVSSTAPSSGLVGHSTQRSFRVRTKGSRQPFSLRSMGDGVNRALGLSLALVNARDGLLLLDEFENGMHYTVQPDIWRHVFRLARELNVQVFATTHSYDCVLAFQEAASETPEDGVLVRLERKADQFRVTTYDEDRLQVIAREEIEVR